MCEVKEWKRISSTQLVSATSLVFPIMASRTCFAHSGPVGEESIDRFVLIPNPLPITNGRSTIR